MIKIIDEVPSVGPTVTPYGTYCLRLHAYNVTASAETFELYHYILRLSIKT
ncbi:MAG: hypothetical protein ACLT3H_08695 [Roseburia sp.]